MLEQFVPQYLGLAFPFILPVAVGSYDVPGKGRWRRPSAEELESERTTHGRNLLLNHPYLDAQSQGEASRVRLYDLTRGLPRRIEAQYRRHWSFAAGLWNLYFKEQVNLGSGLSAVSRGTASNPQDDVEQDAAVAAADLYKKLQHGY